MKKYKSFLIGILFLLMFLPIPAVQAETTQFFGIGAELFKDPFNKKVIITKIIPNSPVERLGILAGSEIVQVDGKRIKKLSLCEVISKIRGDDGTDIKLVIRNGWKRKTYELKRELITVNEPTNPHFEMHWKQIAPICFECSKFICKDITDKFSRKYKRTILPVVNYWVKRKAKFEESYNACMTYSKENQENCLINLLNRENLTTIEDKKIYKILREKF